VIRETDPDSMAVLPRTTGRQPGNLSSTLKTISRYGLVELQRGKTHVRPVVTATEFRILAAACEVICFAEASVLFVGAGRVRQRGRRPIWDAQSYPAPPERSPCASQVG